MLLFDAEAERVRLTMPHRGHRTWCGTEERALLAGIPTIVVVAGRTRVRAATVVAVGRATVPPTCQLSANTRCADHTTTRWREAAQPPEKKRGYRRAAGGVRAIPGA